MGLTSTFDVSRVTNLENRLDTDESIMVTTNDANSQSIPKVNITGQMNALVMTMDTATAGQWFAIMHDQYTYDLALGRFAAGSKAVELRSYYDTLTLRTGRNAAATNADMNFVTNDQAVANISQNMNFMSRGNIRLSPNSPATTADGIECLLVVTGSVPAFRSINTARSAMMLKFGSNGLYARDHEDSVYEPIFASAFNVSSDLSFKENIDDYQESAIDHIKNTKVRTYNLKNDSNKNARIGLIRGEAPAQLQADDDTLDLYQMVSMLWKAVQELTSTVETLQAGNK